MTEAEAKRARVLIWDLPTRVFHWALLALVVLAWRTAETRDLSLHRLAGSGVVGLLVFRIWWGVFGSSSARFSGFMKGPGAVWAYARSLFSGAPSAPEAGHNPMGGWSVAALLLCLLALTGFGLFAVDTDGLESGPLANLVDFDTGRLASHWHALAFDALEALVVLHLLAILFYRFVKHRDLMGPMVTGRSRDLSEEHGLRSGSPVMLILGAMLGLVVALALAHLGGSF